LAWLIECPLKLAFFLASLFLLIIRQQDYVGFNDKKLVKPRKRQNREGKCLQSSILAFMRVGDILLFGGEAPVERLDEEEEEDLSSSIDGVVGRRPDGVVGRREEDVVVVVVVEREERVPG
jgi:hypothetical protein